MAGIHSDKIVQSDVKTFDTFYDKLVAQEPESVDSKNSMSVMPSVLLTGPATMDPSLTQDLVDHWIPRCYRTVWSTSMSRTVSRSCSTSTLLQ